MPGGEPKSAALTARAWGMLLVLCGAVVLAVVTAVVSGGTGATTGGTLAPGYLPALGLITGVAALGLLAVVARRPGRQPRLVPDEAVPDILEEAVSEV